MESHITPEEREALKASDLKYDSPFLIGHVSHSYFSIARHYGVVRLCGYEYVYMPLTDELIRADVMRWLVKHRKSLVKDAVARESQGELF